MSAHDDAEIIAIARVGFLDEAADMLHQFEQALLVMETAPDDAENLNAAFRAAHTIKGTAGLFGLDAVVSFTHEVETLLEALRSGELTVSEPIAAALLEGRDQMGALIDEVRSGDSDPAVRSRSLEASHTSRITSESLGRSRWVSSMMSASTPMNRAMSWASCPMETSCPGPTLNTSPSTAEAGASPRSTNAWAVSVT